MGNCYATIWVFTNHIVSPSVAKRKGNNVAAKKKKKKKNTASRPLPTQVNKKAPQTEHNNEAPHPPPQDDIVIVASSDSESITIDPETNAPAKDVNEAVDATPAKEKEVPKVIDVTPSPIRYKKWPDCQHDTFEIEEGYKIETCREYWKGDKSQLFGTTCYCCNKTLVYSSEEVAANPEGCIKVGKETYYCLNRYRPGNECRCVICDKCWDIKWGEKVRGEAYGTVRTTRKRGRATFAV